MFANGAGDRCSIPGRVIPKILKKSYLIPPCLTLIIIRNGSRVKWSNPLHLSVVAIEKGAFGSPSTSHQLYLMVYSKTVFSLEFGSARNIGSHYHHQVAVTARIPLSFSLDSPLSSITAGRFSKLHPVLSQS